MWALDHTSAYNLKYEYFNKYKCIELCNTIYMYFNSHIHTYIQVHTVYTSEPLINIDQGELEHINSICAAIVQHCLDPEEQMKETWGLACSRLNEHVA